MSIMVPDWLKKQDEADERERQARAEKTRQEYEARRKADEEAFAARHAQLMKIDCCRSCRFSRYSPPNSGGQVLQCHRRAPSGVRSGNYTLACFPHVYDENWCGEYERSGEV